MNEDQKLSLLDRRAAAATAALDEAVQQVPVPEPDLGVPRRSVRRFLPLAVAAGLALVALVGAALVLDDDEQGTIADDGSLIETRDGLTRLALEEPLAAGYEILAAFDASTVPFPDDVKVEMVVHGRTGADNPWDDAAITFQLPYDPPMLNGQVVDVGGPEAVYQPSTGRDTVVVRDGARVHQLVTVRTGKDELISLAADAVRSGWDPLPGHDVLHRGSTYELFPELSFLGSNVGRAGIAYEHEGDDDFVMTWMPGNEGLWRASFALAPEPQRVAVGDRTAVVTSGQPGGGPTMASWLEPDDTLIQVATHGDITRVLEIIQDHASPIEEDTFASLLDRHPATDDQPLLHSGDTGSWNEGPLVASVRETIGAYDFAVELRESSGHHTVALLIGDENGTSGSGFGFTDLETTSMHRTSVGGGPDGEPSSEVLIGGLVGPNLSDLAVVDASTGEAIPLLTWSSATVDGTDRAVFLAVVDSTFRDTPMVVHVTTEDGVIRYRI